MKIENINKVIKNEDVLDGISLATILPGPVAVNVVTYIGYKLRGFIGAMVSMVSIILPSFIFIPSFWSNLIFFFVPWANPPTVPSLRTTR